MGIGPIRITAQTLSVLTLFLASADTGFAGADIARETGLRSGTLYPLLFRLERAGWLSSAWEDGIASEMGRPRRRTYLMTAQGRRQTQAICAQLSEMIGGTAWQSI
ncbi:helix-turn-helix transcriptional regulator [Granulicella rosea]|uniref:helix-turn-helix transcriptional regulator n=1 Tax=Granulicella rosea TaxID=474952 RepID=UPI000B76DBAD